MLFNTWIFAGFLTMIFIIYYSLPKLGLGQVSQVALLFVSSLIFYAYETPILVVLLIVSITVNCVSSKAIVLSSERYGGKMRWVWSAVLINLLLLMFFKYAALVANFIIPEGYMAALKSDLDSIPLPVGISFYTFQAITLIVDLNRKGVVGIESLEGCFNKGKTGQGFLNIAFYIAFFPQLVAGPIVKAHEFIDQIKLKHYSEINWNIVLKSLVIGYFLKMVIADNLKDVTYMLDTAEISGFGKLDLIFLLYGYSFQIFADFAGYSLIAIGLGAAFGYRFPTNFNYPYISGSITEFWRRWHISLSSFLRDYLYIPLGGNKRGVYRTYINLFIVMFLGGLWHGAAWSYAIWGMSHGVILAIEKMYSNYTKEKSVVSKQTLLKKVIKILITFHIVSLLWLLFLMPDFDRVIQYFSVLFTTSTWLVSFQTIYIVVIYSMPIIIYHLIAYIRENSKEISSVCVWRARNIAQPLLLSIMLFFIFLGSGTTGEFIYFQF